MASDPNLQVLGAAYIQHKCYSDNDAKKQVRQVMETGLQGMLGTCHAQHVSLTPDRASHAHLFHYCCVVSLCG